MPWIFLCLMLANAVYFGWKFMEGGQPQPRPALMEQAQQGERVLLLSERPVSVAESPAEPEADEAEKDKEEAVAIPVVAAGTKQCFNIGPFVSEAVLQKWLEQARAQKFTIRVDKRKVDVKDYWVFVPAFTNRERAEERLRDLKSRGIEGFIVKEGVFINAISLNHFSRRDLAQSFLQKMQEAGVAVEFREISQSGTERWAYVMPGRSKADLRGAVDAFLSRQPDLKRENAACEE